MPITTLMPACRLVISAIESMLYMYDINVALHVCGRANDVPQNCCWVSIRIISAFPC